MQNLTLEEIQLGLEVYEKFLLHEAYLKGDKQALTEIKLNFKGLKDLGQKALDKFKSLATNEKTFVGLLGKLKKETGKEASDIIKFIRTKAKEYKGKSLEDIQNDIEKLYNEFTGKKVDEALSDKARKIGGFLALALYLATSLIPSAFASADAIAGLDNAPSMETPVDLEGGDNPNAIDFDDAKALAAAPSGTDIAFDTVKSGVQDQGVKVKLGNIGGAISFDTGEFDASQADIDEVAQDIADDLDASLDGKGLKKAIINFFGIISNTPGDQDNNPSGADKDGLDSKRLDTAKKIADKVQELLKDKYPDADISIGDGVTNGDSVDGQKEVDRGSKEASSTQVAGVSLDDIETGEGEEKSTTKIPPAAKTYFKDPKRELKDISRFRAIFSLFLPLIVDDYDKSWEKVVTAFNLTDEDFPLTRANMRKKAAVLRKKSNRTGDEETALKIVEWAVDSSRYPERLKKQINKLDPKVNIGQRARMKSKAPGARGKDMGVPGSGFTQGNTGLQPTDPSGPRANRGQFRGTQLAEKLNILLEARTDFNILPGFNSSKAKNNLGILVPLYASYWAGEDNLPLSFDIDYVSDTYKETFNTFTQKYPVISKEKNWDDYVEKGKEPEKDQEPTPTSTPEEPPTQEPSKPQQARDEKGRFKKADPTPFDKDPNIEPDVVNFQKEVDRVPALKNRLKQIDNVVELIDLYVSIISYVNDTLHKNSGVVLAGLRDAVKRIEVPGDNPVNEEQKPKRDPAKAIEVLDQYSKLKQILSRVNTQEELVDLLLNGITPYIHPSLHKTPGTIRNSLLRAISEFKDEVEQAKNKKQTYNIQHMNDKDIESLTDINVIKTLLASPYSSIKQRALLRKKFSELIKEGKLTKSQIKRRDQLAKDIKKNTKKQYGKEEGESAAYAIATNIVTKEDVDEARTKQGKKVPAKYLKGLKSTGEKGSKEAMKREIDKFAGKDTYKKDWDADYTDKGKRVKTKQSAATKKYKEMFGESLDTLLFINENSDTALKNKAKKSGIPLSILRAVYRKGKAAWNTGHRPGSTQDQWAMGRVNSFITGSGGARKADAKLWARAKKARGKKNKK